MPYLGKRQMRRIRIGKIFLCCKKIFTCSDAAFCLLLLRHTSHMISSKLVRTVSFVSSVVLVAPLFSTNAALAATATTTSVTATPSPAVAGQSVTLSATTSAPGTVTFSYDGQTVGTGVTTGSGTTLSNIQRWSYTGNSSAWRLASDSNGNIYVSTYNNMDAGGCRQVTKMLTSGGGVPCAPFESWNGNWVSVVGLAVSSTGVIYEAVYNGTAQNTIRSRTSIGATSTTFVSASALGVPSAGQGQITGMTIDASNNLYVTMRDLGEIKRITPAGVVTTYASGLGSPISSPVINPTTNVLYYINADKDIMQIPAGGGSPTLLTAASCNFETWNGSSWYGLGAQLAIDSAGFLYGAQCGGVTPLSTPNAEPITQINPSTGAMRQYLGWDQCMQASLPDGWAAGCGGNQALAFANGRLYTAGAHMGSSGVYGMNPSGYIATFTHTPTNPGVYSVGANLAPTDSGTFSASSGTGSLSVVPAAPQTPDLATSSDLGNSSTDNTTSDNTPRIEVPGNYSSGNTITVTATKSGSTNVTCSYVIPATGCDLGTLADGTWSITATDSHPTSGASSASIALSVTIDTSRPTAPTSVDLVTASDTGSSSTDNNTSDTTPTLGATGGVNGDTMTISATNGTTTVSCTYVVGSATNCTLPSLTDGAWNVTATLTDPAGNTSLVSSALPLTIDATGPQSLTPDLLAASDSGSSSTDDITSDNTPTITLTGQSAGDVITINATNGSSTISCSYTVGSASNCTLATLSDGTWNVSANVTDAAGNTGTTQSLAVNISTSTPNRSTPDLTPTSDTGRSNSDNITNDSTPEITIPGATTGDVVTVSATNGTSTVTCTYTVGTAAGCSLPTLSDGTWTVSASITDAAGNTGPASGSLSITIDGATPATPSTADLLPNSDTGTSDSDNLTNDTTPSFTLPAGTNGDTVTISATKGGETKTCTYIVGVATQCDLPALNAGDWSVTATVTDPAGNSSSPSAPINISIDTKSSTSSISGLNAGGLPSSSATETKPVMKTGPNSLTGLIKFSPNAGAKGATSVVFTVFDKSGKIVNFITKRLKPTDTSASVMVRNNGSLASIRVHTVNSVGVSQSARSGANVKRAKTSNGQLVDGQPKLRGDLLSEIMYFKPNSATLTPRTIQLLNQVARTINSRGGNLFVSGFARKNGIDTPKYLRNLSEQRALAVSMYLSSKGVRLWTTYQGFGAVTTEIGTSAERRVELRWFSN